MMLSDIRYSLLGLGAFVLLLGGSVIVGEYFGAPQRNAEDALADAVAGVEQTLSEAVMSDGDPEAALSDAAAEAEAVGDDNPGLEVTATTSAFGVDIRAEADSRWTFEGRAEQRVDLPARGLLVSGVGVPDAASSGGDPAEGSKSGVTPGVEALSDDELRELLEIARGELDKRSR